MHTSPKLLVIILGMIVITASSNCSSNKKEASGDITVSQEIAEKILNETEAALREHLNKENIGPKVTMEQIAENVIAANHVKSADFKEYLLAHDEFREDYQRRMSEIMKLFSARIQSASDELKNKIDKLEIKTPNAVTTTTTSPATTTTTQSTEINSSSTSTSHSTTTSSGKSQ